MQILLTGGLGFIGSHVASLLGNMDNFKIIIVDNLSNSDTSTFTQLKTLVKYPKNLVFEKGDILDVKFIHRIFQEYNISSIIHFASLKAVAESIGNPLTYYHNNINGLLQILSCMEIYQCKNLIFSSSATVYGNDKKAPLEENMQTGQDIINPYGQTKYFQEQILHDFMNIHRDFQITILRYFNPVGAHPSGIIGENPNDIPNNLFPYLLKVVTNEYPVLTIFGNDYNTKDGTCVRDFIHVMDVADSHIVCLKNTEPGIYVYNVGTGKGVSVLELVNTFEKANNCNVPYVFSSRREGDSAETYAKVDKIQKMLGWSTKYTLEDICRDGYRFIQKQLPDRIP